MRLMTWRTVSGRPWYKVVKKGTKILEEMLDLIAKHNFFRPSGKVGGFIENKHSSSIENMCPSYISSLTIETPEMNFPFKPPILSPIEASMQRPL
jgi:hypothetical protein